MQEEHLPFWLIESDRLAFLHELPSKPLFLLIMPVD